MFQISITTPPPAEQVFIENNIGVWYTIFATPEGGEGVPLLISRAAVWALFTAGAAMFLCILFSGLQMITSGADKGGLQKARSRLTNCLIGLSIVALAWAVAVAIQWFFGVCVFGVGSACTVGA